MARTRLSPREERDLQIEINFLEGLVARDPGYIDALEILGDDYMRRGSFLDGLRVDKQLAKLRPKDPTAYYNLACTYALMGHVDRAVASLERSIDLGYRDFRWLAQDPDLETVRLDPSFRAIEVKIVNLIEHLTSQPGE